MALGRATSPDEDIYVKSAITYLVLEEGLMRKLLMGCLVALVACGETSTQPAVPTVTGTWTGVSTGVLSYRMTLDLLESRGAVVRSLNSGTDFL